MKMDFEFAMRFEKIFFWEIFFGYNEENDDG